MVLLFGYAPVLLTIGPAAVAAKAIIWLTVFVMAPFVSVLWRTRRKLADATAIQLTRYPGALADAYRALAGLDMKVPGAVEVHFLFPVWDPAVDLADQSRQDVTSMLMHLQLPLEPRLRRLERLGAADGAALAISDPGYTWRQVAEGAGWISLGAVFLAAVMALSVVGAAATLYALGWLLHKVLVAFPRWVVRLSGW